MSEIDDDLDELPAPPRRDIPEADRKLLEMAARALGVVRFEEVEGEGWANLHLEDGSTMFHWNPLVHSDDALELAVKLVISITRRAIDDPFVDAHAVGAKRGCFESLEPDPSAATRRAIVRAAAEIIPGEGS